MERHDFEIRLSGTGEAAGEIGLDRVAEIGRRLVDLATRITRDVAGQTGPGRTAEHPAAAGRLVLRALRAGSTVLAIGFGEPDVLPLDAGQEFTTAARFWEIVEGIESGVRPDWTTPQVAEAADHLIDAIGRAAETSEFTRADGRSAQWRRDRVPREQWRPQVGDPPAAQETITVVGRLERVDLRSGQFRIRDDVGNAIDLIDVVDPEGVGPLVGQRTTASGIRVGGPNGKLSLREPVLLAAPTPDAWRPGGAADWSALVEAVPGPDPDGVAGITVSDVADLLARIRG